jgi:CheY-like chemotaxis protein
MEPRSDPSTSAAAQAPVRILVAEDDADILEMLEVVLASHGMEVLRARHGSEALAVLRGPTPHPDIVLLDLRMRVMDGAAFLAEKQADPLLAEIPVVIMTALSPMEQEATGLQVAGWLSKPLKLNDLLRTLAAVLHIPPPGVVH